MARRSDPNRMALDVCKAVAEGDFEARITGIDPNDTYAALYHAINRMIDRTDAYVRESTASLEYVSQKKYFRRIVETGMVGAFRDAAVAINGATQSMEDQVAGFATVVEHFQGAMQGVVESVTSASTELETSAQSMRSTAVSTSQQATAVAAAAGQASANVQTVAASAEELSSTISDIRQRANRSAEIVGEAVDQVRSTGSETERLAGASERIGDVIQLITDIAAQTNLLALNATIEAARAGEAGKGFAVVASEVKSLANQTATATDDIRDQITSIQGATSAVVAAIDGVGATMEQVTEMTASIASTVEEQGAATAEIARSIEEAATGTAEVTTNIADVNQAADHSKTAAGEVLDAASDLAKQADVLRSGIDSFLLEVKQVI
ncbi:methyl-accepting chemotaxis protein [Algihabitans albus]|uniref:methyl-accepting chemotaxis protein n=1 Tax=Algihabitans albus TaxID=2164067 RepID=UPI0035D11C0F